MKSHLHADTNTRIVQNPRSILRGSERLFLVPREGREDSDTRSLSVRLLDDFGDEVCFVGMMESGDGELELVAQAYDPGKIDLTPGGISDSIARKRRYVQFRRCGR